MTPPLIIPIIKRLFLTASILPILIGYPEQVSAHGAERGLVMLLPTGYYKIGAAIAVAASFVILAWIPRRFFHIQTVCLTDIWNRNWRWAPTLSIASFGMMCLLLISGYTGNHDPLDNPLPLFIWTLWWVGFTLVQCVVGNLWAVLNPWSGLLRVCNYLCKWRRPPFVQPIFTLPKALGYTPAILIFFCFAWFELVDLAPEDPTRLANAILIYWLFTFIACLLFGEAVWMRYCEPFSIFFRFIANCGIFSTLKSPGQNVKTIHLPGKKILFLPPLPLSGVLFILLTLSTVSFDGLSKTFLWLGAIDINPLAFPGRSAVTQANSLGLILTFLALASAYYLCVYLGCRAINRPEDFKTASGRLVYSIVPISLVFHFSHYLTLLLTNGQYALLAFNDPFNLGWNLLGTKDYVVTTSFLSHLHSVSVIWSIQTIAIVVGHIVGISIAHLIAIRIFNNVKSATISQLFLAVLMVGYTVFGLWLLSTPGIG